MRTHLLSSIILLVGVLGIGTQASGMIWQQECAKSITQLAERQREISKAHDNFEMMKLTKQFSPHLQVDFNLEKDEKDKEISNALTSLKMTLGDFNVELSQFQKKCLSN